MNKRIRVPKTKFGVAVSYIRTPNFGWMFTIALGFKIQPKGKAKEFYFFIRISDFVLRVGYNA